LPRREDSAAARDCDGPRYAGAIGGRCSGGWREGAAPAACTGTSEAELALARQLLIESSDGHLQSLGLEYLPRIGIFILLCAVAATTRNLRFHALFVFAAFAYELSFFGRYYATLN
jgi:hypothetical protein